jgi:regulator of nucleoside diphosphate kinase
MTTELPEVKINKRDFEHLDELLGTLKGGQLPKGADILLEELSRAKVLDRAEIGSDTVAMHARILIRDEDSGRTRSVVLVYPSERSREDALSVLSPLGAALIGIDEGQSVEFDGPDGTRRRVTVMQVTPPAEDDPG